MSSIYTSSVERGIWDKVGETPSVLDYGCVMDGVTDCTDAFQRALDSVAGSGGGDLLVPRGTLLFGHITVPSSVALVGKGTTSILKRASAIPAGKGWLDLPAGTSNVDFINMAFEGTVIGAPAGKNYSSFTDPMDAALVLNTSIWIHGGCSNISFQKISIAHTGGYGIMLDARLGDIYRVRIIDSDFSNNRPFLFGDTIGDYNYGSWVGPIHVQGDGSTYAASDVEVSGCRFRRNTGNCIHTHLYGFGKLHTNIRVHDNSFEDCGLDGVLMGGVSGGSVEGNSFRRIGYVCTDDTSPSVPKYLANHYAVGLDTSGLVKQMAYKGNTFQSCNGGCMDLDGYSEGVVSGNVCSMPEVGSLEYTEDSIALSGPGGVGANWTYGCQPSNTNNILGPGMDIMITGNTFLNMGGGAVRLFAARNCFVTGNNIKHPDLANYPPIAMGNIGTGSYQRANGNVVADNTITYNPGTEAPAVIEDSTYGAFDPADKNWVGGNHLIGNCYEFLKDSGTDSSTSVMVSAAARFMVLRDGTYSDTEADLLPATHALLKYDSATSTILSSVATASGSRVWTPFGGGSGLPAWITTQNTGPRYIHFEQDGVATALNPNVDGAEIRLGVSAWTGSAAYSDYVWLRAASNGYLSARFDICSPYAGYLNRMASFIGGGGGTMMYLFGGMIAYSDITVFGYVNAGGGFNTAGTAYNIIQAPSGGLFAGLGVTTNQALYPKGYASSASLNTPGAGYGGLGWKSGSIYWYYNGSAWAQVDFSATGGVSSITGTSNQVIASASTGAVTLSLPQDIATISDVAFNSVTTVSAAGFYGKDSGGVARQMLSMGSDDNVYLGNPISAHDVYIRPAANRYIFMGIGTAEVVAPNVTGAASLGNSTYRWNNCYITILNASSTATVGGAASAAGLTLTNGWFQSNDAAGGFHSSGTAYNAFQATAGGIYVGLGVTTDQALYPKGYASSASLNTPGAGYGGLGWKSSSIYWYYNGSAWAQVDLASVGGGVSSITGTTNQITASASTGAVTLSLPQNIHTAADVLFNTVTTANAAGFYGKDSGGTARQMLSMGSDDNVYLGNPVATHDVYIRPVANRFIFMGIGTAEVVAPNGTGTASLGNSTYRWSNCYITTLNLSGTATVGGAASAAGLTLTSGWFQANDTAGGFHSSGTAYNAFQATAGGIYVGLGVTTDQALYPKGYASSASLNAPGGGYGGFGWKSGSVYWYYNGSAWAQVDLATTGGGVTSLTGTTNQVTASASTGAVTLSLPQNIHTSADVIFNTVTAANNAGYYSKDTGGTARQILTIGADNNVYLTNPVASQDVYIRPATNRFIFMGIGSAEVLAPNGTATASLGNSTYRWNNCYITNLDISGTVTGAVKSVGGFTGVVTLTAGTAISISGVTITNTGVTALSAGTGISVSGSTGSITVTNNGVTSATASTGISVSGSTGAVTFTNTGVTSAVAGTGVSVSGSTGAVTFSIGQAVGTSAGVTFGSVTTAAGGVIQSGATGATIAFQTTNANFQVDGNGNISGAGSANLTGGYKVAGNSVINSSGVFVGASGINVGSAGITCGGINPNGGYTGQTWNVVGTFTISGTPYTTLIFRGGVLVSAS